ncbi:MAG: hypothetical protein ACYDD6_10045 [Acidimicrobiales bacterium]
MSHSLLPRHDSQHHGAQRWLAISSTIARTDFTIERRSAITIPT